MKQVIYKYPLSFAVEIDGGRVYSPVKMPKDAQILTLQVQGGIPTLWARVLVDRPLGAEEVRTFRIFGTGHDLPLDAVLEYIGTFQQGQFVWHVFEDNPPVELDGSYQ